MHWFDLCPFGSQCSWLQPAHANFAFTHWGLSCQLVRPQPRSLFFFDAAMQAQGGTKRRRDESFYQQGHVLGCGGERSRGMHEAARASDVLVMLMGRHPPTDDDKMRRTRALASLYNRANDADDRMRRALHLARVQVLLHRATGREGPPWPMSPQWLQQRMVKVRLIAQLKSLAVELHQIVGDLATEAEKEVEFRNVVLQAKEHTEEELEAKKGIEMLMRETAEKLEKLARDGPEIADVLLDQLALDMHGKQHMLRDGTC